MPLSEQKFTVTVTDSNSVLWVKIDVPADIAPWKYVVSVQFKMTEAFSDIPENTLCKDMEIEIIPCRAFRALRNFLERTLSIYGHITAVNRRMYIPTAFWRNLRLDMINKIEAYKEEK